MSTEITPERALALLATELESGTTIRDWFTEVLLAFWHEGEGFSGKRPLGNSSWFSDIEAALIRAGVIAGSVDADGYVETDEDTEAIVAATLRALMAGTLPRRQTAAD